MYGVVKVESPPMFDTSSTEDEFLAALIREVEKVSEKASKYSGVLYLVMIVAIPLSGWLIPNRATMAELKVVKAEVEAVKTGQQTLKKDIQGSIADLKKDIQESIDDLKGNTNNN